LKKVGDKDQDLCESEGKTVVGGNTLSGEKEPGLSICEKEQERKGEIKKDF